MALGLQSSIITTETATIQASRPPGSIPADAYQQPVAEGDDYYWRTRSGGYYQIPDGILLNENITPMLNEDGQIQENEG